MRIRKSCRVGVLAAVVVLLPLGCARRTETAADAVQVAGTVTKELAADPDLAPAATAIRVTVRDGVVTLSGRVPNEAAKREAASVADDVDGVDRVDNRLTVATANEGAETTRVDRVPPVNRPAPPPAPNAPPRATDETKVPRGAEPAPQPAGE